MEQRCSVCLEPVSSNRTETNNNSNDQNEHQLQQPARVKPCNHIYHKDCIEEWSKKANSCPQCRCKFNEIVIVQDQNIEMSDDKDSRSTCDGDGADTTIHVEDAVLPIDGSEFPIPQEFIEENDIVSASLGYPMNESHSYSNSDSDSDSDSDSNPSDINDDSNDNSTNTSSESEDEQSSAHDDESVDTSRTSTTKTLNELIDPFC
ncbi:unnamed protein product [Ambrosiozyma monospora]|uniref:Unnamed protein product n=1 Tax=Ambrosiozyma monospora TaxID=43982 RepID=A0ACB5T6E2_AMBMO|nr:unnamed protein product [Ambrosiozyma monospora]